MYLQVCALVTKFSNKYKQAGRAGKFSKEKYIMVRYGKNKGRKICQS